jgi:HTH-type transcriptional regulator, sugar sensing transcriptional regulator
LKQGHAHHQVQEDNITENPILARLLTAFLNTEYYIIRASNQNPVLMGQMLSEVLEPEDWERYAHVLRFLEQQATGIEQGES